MGESPDIQEDSEKREEQAGNRNRLDESRMRDSVSGRGKWNENPNF